MKTTLRELVWSFVTIAASSFALTGLGWVFPASAADLKVPAKAPAAIVAPPDVWTGLYGGVNLGYGWDTSAFPINAFPTTIDFAAQPQGVVGGIQIGYGMHSGILYAGLETDIQGAALRGSAAMPGLLTVNGNMDWFGTVRARLGLVLFNDLLVYGTGGFAYGNVSDSFSFSGGPSATGGATQTGWVVGAGVEHALAPGWTIKAEYLRVDLGTVTATDPVTSITLTPTFQADIVRAGVNYHF